MLSIKIQMALATVAAILSGLLVLGVSYLFTPYPLSNGQMPIPEPSTSYQIFMGFIWIGLAALIAFSIVGLGVVINRIRQKKTPEDFEAQAGD